MEDFHRGGAVGGAGAREPVDQTGDLGVGFAEEGWENAFLAEVVEERGAFHAGGKGVEELKGDDAEGEEIDAVVIGRPAVLLGVWGGWFGCGLGVICWWFGGGFCGWFCGWFRGWFGAVD